MKKYFVALTVLFCLFTIASASVPGQINYQGILKDTAGKAVTDHALPMVFSIYSGASGGTPLWTEIQTVSVDAGSYSVQLGSVNPIGNIFDGNTRYLGIKVGTDPEMSPRLPLISVPYAFRAATAESAALATTANNAVQLGGRASALTGANVVPYTGSNGLLDQSIVPPTGIATNAANADRLDGLHASNFVLFGTTEAQVTDHEKGINVTTTTADGYAVYGHAAGAGQNYGGYFMSISSSGTGVYGKGAIAGVSGESTSGKGVYGKSSAQGVWGETLGGQGVYGISTNGQGVMGLGGSYGGYFFSNVSGGTGVYGKAAMCGGTFEATDASGYGVYAKNSTAVGANAGAGLYVEGKIKSLVSVAAGAGAVGTKSGAAAGWGGGVSCVVNNPYVNPASLIFIFPAGGVVPAGHWTVSPAPGNFTVTSSAAEAGNPDFNYLIIN